MSAFRSVRAPSYDVDGLVAKLNEAAAEGWDVVTVVPSSSDLVAILRKVEAPAAAAPAAAPAAEAKKDEAVAAVKEEAAEAKDADAKAGDDLDAKVSGFLGTDDVEKKAAAAVAAEKAVEAGKPEPAGWGSAPVTSTPVPASTPSTPSPTPSAATPAAAAPAAAAPTPVPAAPSATAPGAATPAAGGAAKPATPAGWYPDPSGRYELRYWNGTDWSEHVARGGQQFTDPPVA